MSYRFAERGGWWVVWQAVFMVAVMTGGPLCKQAWMHTASFPFGIFLIAVGAIFGIAGAWMLGRNRTAFPRPLEGAHLVTSGVYGIVRHPLYSSLIFLGFGWALVWQSAVAMVCAAALTIFLWCKAQREERWLREQFAGYEAYSKRVRRFVPGIF